MDTNRSKRFDFLLKQTEIFSHFMPGNTGKITPEKKKSGRKKEETKKQPQNAATLDPAE